MGIVHHPNNVRVRFTDAQLRCLYLERLLTLEQVAEQLGVSAMTIRRRLGDLGIPARPRGPYHDPEMLRIRMTWSPSLAYVIGLIATDGNLSGDGRHLSVSSRDPDLLESVRESLQLAASITPCSGTRCYRIQWGDRPFYTWLLGLGLMPAKSLRLGPIAVPNEFFPDFVRGCIDGDGSIVTYRDHFNARKKPAYVYDRLYVSIVSASPEFLPWIQETVRRLCGVVGHLTVKRSEMHNPLWRLRYAKRESAMLLSWIYYSPEVPSLRRKREHAERALIGATWYRHSLSEALDR